MPTAEQIRKIYGLAKGLNISTGGKDDDLHAVVLSVTGKESIRELNEDEYKAVYLELVYRAKLSGLKEPAKRRKSTSTPSGITQAQIARIWALMYELADYDAVKSEKSLGERLCAIIKKELHIDCRDNRSKKNSIFMWLSADNGAKLIEVLKRYVASARCKHGGSV